MQLPLQYWPEKSSSTAILILLSEICAAAAGAAANRRAMTNNDDARNAAAMQTSLLGFILAGEARAPVQCVNRSIEFYLGDKPRSVHVFPDLALGAVEHAGHARAGTASPWRRSACASSIVGSAAQVEEGRDVVRLLRQRRRGAVGKVHRVVGERLRHRDLRGRGNRRCSIMPSRQLEARRRVLEAGEDAVDVIRPALPQDFEALPRALTMSERSGGSAPLLAARVGLLVGERRDESVGGLRRALEHLALVVGSVGRPASAPRSP